MSSGQGKMLSRGIRGRVKELKSYAAANNVDPSNLSTGNIFSSSWNSKILSLANSNNASSCDNNISPTNTSSWGNNTPAADASSLGNHVSPTNTSSLGNNTPAASSCDNNISPTNTSSWGNNTVAADASSLGNHVSPTNTSSLGNNAVAPADASWSNHVSATNTSSWGNNTPAPADASWSNKVAATKGNNTDASSLGNNVSAIKDNNTVSSTEPAKKGGYGMNKGRRRDNKPEDETTSKVSTANWGTVNVASTWSNSKISTDDSSKPNKNNDSWGNNGDSKDKDIPEKRTFDELSKENVDIAISGVKRDQHIVALDTSTTNSWGNNNSAGNSSMANSKASTTNASWGNNNTSSWGNNVSANNTSSWGNNVSATKANNTVAADASSWGNNTVAAATWTEPAKKGGYGMNKGRRRDNKPEDETTSKVSTANWGTVNVASTWGNSKISADDASKPKKNNDSWGNKGDSKDKDKKEDKNAPHSTFIPEKRTVDELFKEDVENAEFYRIVTEDDEDIAISGVEHEHIVALDKWENAGFEEIVLNNIRKSQYVRPRKIQAYTVPLILEGRDIQGHAETGSGKTAAFMLPIINVILKTKDFDAPDVELGRPSPFAIIVEPTRELCAQVAEQGRKFADGTRIMVAKTYGQYDMGASRKEIMMGCDILCATPGRLKHVLTSKWVSLDKLKFFVLDEADRLLEDGFIDIIRECLDTPKFPKKDERQNLLFSATFPEEIQKLSTDVLRKNNIMVSNKKIQNDPNKPNDPNQINQITANSKIMQTFISVEAHEKKKALLDILKKDADSSKDEPICRTLVFVKTRREADLLALWLSSEGVKATNINGDRTQSQRERALRDFRVRNTYVLVSTDVCARGIDIKDLDHVVNFDLPDDKVTYVHRIGRTGRIKNGFATSFFDENSEKDRLLAKDLVKFARDAGQEPPEFLKKAANNGFPDGFDINDPWGDNNPEPEPTPIVIEPTAVWN